MSTLQIDGNAGTVERTADTLGWVIVGTTFTLLGMAFSALVLMKNGAINQRLGIAFVILSFVALGLVEGILVWRLLHLNKSAQDTRALAYPTDLSTEEPGLSPARALHVHAEPVPSVNRTDHTRLRALVQRAQPGINSAREDGSSGYSATSNNRKFSTSFGGYYPETGLSS